MYAAVSGGTSNSARERIGALARIRSFLSIHAQRSCKTMMLTMTQEQKNRPKKSVPTTSTHMNRNHRRYNAHFQGVHHLVELQWGECLAGYLPMNDMCGQTGHKQAIGISPAQRA